MKASSASGLWARWIVRVGLAGGATRLPAADLRRLLMESVEVLRVLAVLGPGAGALGRLVLEEVAVGPSRARGVARQLQSAGPQHECEQVRGDRAADRVRLCQRCGRVPSG